MRAKGAFVIYLIMKIVSTSKSKSPLPYFRRKAEGVQEDITLKPFTEDLSINLVSFIIKNAREIFDDIDDGNGNALSTPSITPDELLSYEPLSKEDVFVSTQDVVFYKNLSLTTLLDHNLIEPQTDRYEFKKKLVSELMQLTKEMKSYEKSDEKIDTVLTSISSEKSDEKIDTVLTSISSDVLETTEQNDPNPSLNESKRSCILCNNILYENCDDPRNKIIPTSTCEREGDLCYSQHTPFGIVDRGCFNVNHNLTTYVCSCNLCNYISISEMPYIFSNKQDWVDNVVELSRTKNFKKSVFKDMSCLRCEVNSTSSNRDVVDCLEGNIGNLPIQDCEKNEICAVKAVRSDGYIWRGCVRIPLYNYWWNLCDTDLCNYENLVPIYDFVSLQKSTLLG